MAQHWLASKNKAKLVTVNLNCCLKLSVRVIVFLYVFYPNTTLLHNIQQKKYENTVTNFSKVNRHLSKMSHVTITKNVFVVLKKLKSL